MGNQTCVIPPNTRLIDMTEASELDLDAAVQWVWKRNPQLIHDKLLLSQNNIKAPFLPVEPTIFPPRGFKAYDRKT